ncbi:hypothetical protein RND81_06G116900 [Saponaria officinalis]|uniref:Uncharacterized protein n=1 Tax=Saponaria officinalis TaxID=3572 RepID=A0AAW1KA37_SAPOF
MAGGARRSTVNGGSVTHRNACSPSRPIPMRGQIKGRIVMRLAQSVASIFSSATPSHT